MNNKNNATKKSLPEKIVDKVLFKISATMNYPWWFNNLHINILYRLFGFQHFDQWWVMKQTIGNDARSDRDLHYRLIPLLKYVQIKELNSVFELGGAWGNMAKTMYDAGFTGQYSIRDLPIVEKLQDYYLSGKISHDDIEYPDLFYAGFSLSEMSLKDRKRYESKIDKAKYVFIYYQAQYHEINNVKYFTELTQNIHKTWIHQHKEYCTNILIGIKASN